VTARAETGILLVEDDSDDVLFMKRALKKAGIQSPLRVARDGQEAIDYLGGHLDFADRSRHPLPSYVYLDLKLPRKSGLEVLEWMRERTHEVSEIPVIVLTSSREPRDVQRVHALRGRAYCAKPVGFEDLLDLVTRVHFWIQEGGPLPAALSRHCLSGQAV
jgi:CheY-like chemotaxis protein